MPRQPSPLFRAGLFLWRFKLTPPGRVLVLAILLTALGSVITQLPIYQLFCGLLALLAVAETTGLILKPSIRIEGSPPSRSAAGETVRIQFQLTNRSKWRPAFDLMMGVFGLPQGVVQVDADVYLPCLKPLQRGALPLTLRTDRRGIYPLPAVYCVSTFPFNLVRFSGGRTAPGRLVVLPSYHSLDELDLPTSYRYQMGESSLTQGIGHSPEYIGNREYVPGESVRRIDSRAWARIGRPVVKEYHEEYVSRVALVLDTFLPARGWRPAGWGPGGWSSGGNAARLEAGVSLMAAVAERLNVHEHVIDLFAAGPEMYVFRSAGGTPHFDSVLEILSGLDACRRNPFEQISPLVIEELETISTVVCIFLDWDATRAEFVRRVLESGCRLKGVLIVDPQRGPSSAGPPDLDGEWTVVSAAEIQSGRLRRL